MKGLILENALAILLIVIFAILFVMIFSLPLTPCEKPFPTGGDIVDCIATRTAEAKNR